MNYNVIISSASPTIQFVGNDVCFSARAYPSNTFNYIWNMQDGSGNIITTSDTYVHKFNNKGQFFPIVKVSANDGVGFSTPNVIIKINPRFNITFSGTPKVSKILTFYISNSNNYHAGTITSLKWDFGDSTTASMALPTDSVTHIYTDHGLYSVKLSAIDVSGNIAISNISIAIIDSELYEKKVDYITLCGPRQTRRYGKSRYINLTEYLPSYLKDSPTQTFLQFFEDFLNKMFPGMDGLILSSSEVPVTKGYNLNPFESNTSAFGKMINTYEVESSAGTVTVSSDSSLKAEKMYIIEPDSLSSTDPRISILEKIQRLTELHDPSLIDLEYIQFFASNLGYNINVNRNEVGLEFGTTIVDEISGCSGDNQEKYLRFIVESLPSWYKIKSTNNAIKIMLYSFGLIADMVNYYTGLYTGNPTTDSDYKPTSEGGKWKIDFQNSNFVLENKLNKNFYPTPHFAIFVNMETSLEKALTLSNLIPAIKAIDTVRPINTVFRRLIGYRTNLIDLYVGMVVEGSILHKIDNNNKNTFSNWWYN